MVVRAAHVRAVRTVRSRLRGTRWGSGRGGRRARCLSRRGHHGHAVSARRDCTGDADDRRDTTQRTRFSHVLGQTDLLFVEADRGGALSVPCSLHLGATWVRPQNIRFATGRAARVSDRRRGGRSGRRARTSWWTESSPDCLGGTTMSWPGPSGRTSGHLTLARRIERSTSPLINF